MPTRQRPRWVAGPVSGTRAGRLLALLVVAGMVLAGCSSGASGGGAGAASEEPMVPGVKPEFTVPADRVPPDELVVEELLSGEGPVVRPGDTVQIHWVGRAWSTGVEFDSSWDRGPPLTVELGAGRVIPGMEQGLEGRRVGGRYRLVIPPELAYGDEGTRGAIEPGETLVFVVDVLEIVSDEGSS